VPGRHQRTDRRERRDLAEGGGFVTDDVYAVDNEWDAVEDDGVLDASDTLDDDLVGDPLDVGYQTADRYSGVTRFGTTIAEQRAGESLDQLLSEEEPDIDPYAGQKPDLDEDELIRRGPDAEPRSGRLVADDEWSDTDEALAYDVGIDAGAASAEEAAVHIVDDPNGPGAGPSV
jgi:hypothetical protein